MFRYYIYPKYLLNSTGTIDIVPILCLRQIFRIFRQPDVSAQPEKPNCRSLLVPQTTYAPSLIYLATLPKLGGVHRQYPCAACIMVPGVTVWLSIKSKCFQLCFLHDVLQPTWYVKPSHCLRIALH